MSSNLLKDKERFNISFEFLVVLFFVKRAREQVKTLIIKIYVLYSFKSRWPNQFSYDIIYQLDIVFYMGFVNEEKVPNLLHKCKYLFFVFELNQFLISDSSSKHSIYFFPNNRNYIVRLKLLIIKLNTQIS